MNNLCQFKNQQKIVCKLNNLMSLSKQLIDKYSKDIEKNHLKRIADQNTLISIYLTSKTKLINFANTTLILQ